ncbi:MAG: Gldg family protein [bacterium]
MKYRSISLLILFFSVVAASVSYNLVKRSSTTFDWTQNQSFSLSSTSLELIQSLEHPLTVEVFVSPGNLKDSLQRYLQLYKQDDSRVILKFINPADHLQRIRSENIRAEGTMIFTYQGRHTRIEDELSETRILKALRELLNVSHYQISFSQGHGERQIDDQSASGLSQFSQQLATSGSLIKISQLSSQIDTQTDMLIIASPIDRFEKKQIKRIMDFIHQGGSLVLLLDPDSAQANIELLNELGLTPAPGTLVDGTGQSVGLTDPSIIYIPATLENKAQTDSLRLLLPRAAALSASKSWQVLTATSPTSWNETSTLSTGKIARDEDSEKAGPWPLAFYQEQARSRLVVILDSDLISNAYLDTLDNKNWINHLIQWAAAGSGIKIQPIEHKTDNLNITAKQSAIAGLFLLLILPALLGLAGWHLRKKYA